MANTLTERLEAVRTAIDSAITDGFASVTMDGITSQKWSLNQLTAMEDRLLRQLSIRNRRKRTTPDFS